MSRRIRTGFTLVELLVVITIIGILAGMLFPAIQVMRASARKTQCLNNITQVGKAALNYESSKQRFPSFKNLRPGFPKTSAPVDNNYYIVGWVPPMLSYLGRADLYNMYSDTKYLDPSIAADPRMAWPPASTEGKPLRLELLACPADTEQEIEAEMHYVINGGMMDNVANISANPSGQPDFLVSNPVDFVENGISFDQTLPSPIKSSNSYLAQKDGPAMVILFAENEDADRNNGSTKQPRLGWDGYAMGATRQAVLDDWNSKGYEYLNTVLWLDLAEPVVPLNKEPEPTATTGPHDFARPSSGHTGGFHVFFGGGNARFISDEISYDLYKALLTADGRNARSTFKPVASNRIPTLGDPISDSDLDK